MKKVLMIAYFFPPLGGSGVQRTLKFVKYLPQFGILPVVSTVKNGHNFAYDESLLEEVPGSVKVYRSSSLETLWLREALEKIAGLRKGKEEEIPEKVSKDAQLSEAKSGQKVESEQKAEADGKGTPEHKDKSEHLPEQKPLKARIFDFIDNYLFIPDSKVRWLPFGFLKSLQTARRENVDYLFSSSYPYTVHWIARWVHKLYRRPWIADFRDPWVGNKAMQKDIPFRKKLDAWMERKVVEEADYIINVTPSITETYKERYPEYADKMVTITNGYDPVDFAKATPVKQEKFTLIHTGIIADAYDMETFADGVRLFLERHPEERENVQILFIGYVPEHFDALLKRKLGKAYVFKSYMSHQSVLEYLAGAQLQFMTFDRSVDNAYSGKLFDYIGTGKPILGLLPEGVAAQLIRERRLGTVVSLGDIEGLAAAIERHYNAWQSSALIPNDLQGPDSKGSTERCEEFSRVNLAGQLAGLFPASAQGTNN
ncbi:glycosyltransferase [Desulfitobacterium sp. Sab5]|uniref:glycosyltransferase n=1 Tax=Desulfitobacterium nosdiversum TaxID=3375356 RepID=UPI003CF21DF0